jgi:hypothetical protein
MAWIADDDDDNAAKRSISSLRDERGFFALRGVTDVNPDEDEDDVELAAVVSMLARFRGVFLNTDASSGATVGMAAAISSGVESA